MTDVPSRGRVLILGGTGVFGSRLSERLSRDSGLQLIIAGRHRQKAEILATALRASCAGAHVEGAAIPIDRELKARITDLAPSLVIHAAGPFQGQDYAVAEAALAAGADYIDLSDGRDFVSGFGKLDAAARERGLAAITGASTVPALSSVVVADLARDMDQVTLIDFGICPGNKAARGEAVVKAILGYCGQPIPGRERGEPVTRYGWGGLRRVEIEGVGRRWIFDCDIPDLDLLPQIYPDASVRFGAGLELSAMHLGLAMLSALVRRRLLPRLDLFAGPVQRIAQLFRPFGSDVGGMYVRVDGIAGGHAATRSWSLAARQGHGPYVPTLPAAIVARKILKGDRPRAGAYPCLNMFDLSDMAAEIGALEIDWRQG